MDYFPASHPTGATIVVCPGGGYTHLAPHEGAPVAIWLNTLGIHAWVLRYRLGPAHRHPAMLDDVTRALRVARSRAPDSNRVGVLGFSAGGHLAASACTLFTEGDPDASDPIDRLSSRPDLGILLYPVITLTSPFAHAGSRKNLLGENPPSELVEQLSLDRRVTPRTPPAFLFHTADDPGVPVENSLLYASALRACGVPFELHCFEHGRHGVGLATDDPILGAWPGLCAHWLKARGF
jgi:acetyl esterase/lipase